MTAIVTNMPAGFAGEVTRSDGAVVVSLELAADLAHGSPVKITGGKAAAIESSDTAAVFYGVLTRSAPSVSDASTGNADTAYVQSILRKGFVNVACKQGTPAIGGAVYVRVVADSGKLVGDFEATGDMDLTPGTITGTGTGTLAGTVTSETMPGTWSLVLQTTSNTSKVTVIDPAGIRRDDATCGTPYTSADGFAFTITSAGTMTAGDSFAPVVTANNVAITGATWATAGKDSNNIAEAFFG